MRFTATMIDGDQRVFDVAGVTEINDVVKRAADAEATTHGTTVVKIEKGDTR